MRLLTLIVAGVLFAGTGMTMAGEMHNHDMKMKDTVQKADAGHQMKAALKSEGTQTTCPVMGGTIDKKVFVDHEGKRVYFCCPACKATFKKDPATYLSKIADKGETPALLALAPQTACPVMVGNKINRKIFADHNGKRVYFCCNSCKPQFKKNPEKYLKKLEEMGQEAEDK